MDTDQKLTKVNIVVSCLLSDSKLESLIERAKDQTAGYLTMTLSSVVSLSAPLELASYNKERTKIEAINILLSSDN